MSKVTEFSVIRGGVAAPDSDVVELLEDMLARAKAGEIQGVGVASVRANGDTASSYAGTISAPLLGGVSLLRARIEGVLLG